MTPAIVLSTLNAKYIHAAFGLRYLLANLGELRPCAQIVEFDINQRPSDIAEALLARDPKIIGLGVYIWNVTPTTDVVAIIKRVRPDICIILGGPEVSYETETQRIAELADYVVTGEADLTFKEVCGQLLAGKRPAAKIIPASLPDFSQLVLPYDLYDDQDVAHRIIYVEASRGCPFTCEFCLSSLDIPVRQAPLNALLAHLEKLLARGVKQFKFVDRTFNLNVRVGRAILEFFLERHQPGHFLHFEMIPDRLPEALREIITRFPPGALQFEVGIQTFNAAVAGLIQRRQDYERLADNLRFLRLQTGVHIHADLIAGLPGETLESFGAGFDRLIALGPQEIQVGILKRLRGTPIVRHDGEWQMVYNASPPYEILQTKLIDFATMQKLRRFARYWDLVGNSGNFVETTSLLVGLNHGGNREHGRSGPRAPSPLNGKRISRTNSRFEPLKPKRENGPLSPALSPSEGERETGREPSGRVADSETAQRSPFWSFMEFSEWLHGEVGRTDSIALVRLMELIFEYLTGELKLGPSETAAVMWRDYQRGGRSDKPGFLKQYLPADAPRHGNRLAGLPKRQARHLGSESRH